MLRKERIAVTGSSGLLGNEIVKLAKRNYEVTSLHNTKTIYSDSVQLDIAGTERVLEFFSRLKPDVVIHTASQTNVDRCETEKENAWNVNVVGTLNIAKACNKVRAKLIYISTDYVFDGEKGNYREQDTPNPINYYGTTKLEGEKQVAQYCHNYAILRTSVLYGWHPWKQNFATWTISQLRQNRQITVVEDHYNTPTLASNLAEMAMEFIEKDLQGLYHSSGSERISRFAFAQQIAKTFELDPQLIKPIRMSQLTAWIAKRPRDSSLDIEKIEKQLRTKPLSITSGVDMMKKEEEER
jgi:dTDP-4-dehydrorhamnose reductase